MGNAATMTRQEYKAYKESVKGAFPKPNGKMVKFYLGKTRSGMYTNPNVPDFLPVSINGHETKYLEMGKEHELPEEYVQQIMNAKSKTRVVDVRQAERNPRLARPSNYMEGAPIRDEYINDYEVHIIKEK